MGSEMCIRDSPKQVPSVNQGFMPDASEIERAEKIISAFEAAEAAGSASIQVDGYFIDYPIVEKAYAIRRLARTFG